MSPAFDAMLYEERTYTLYPGTVPAFLSVYEHRGLEIHRRHLGSQVGFFVTEVGVLNQVVQLFAFQDVSDREHRRAALYADQEWLDFVPVFKEFIIQMESRLLIPTRFSQLK
jgi:hypothetical protein